LRQHAAAETMHTIKGAIFAQR